MPGRSSVAARSHLTARGSRSGRAGSAYDLAGPRPEAARDAARPHRPDRRGRVQRRRHLVVDRRAPTGPRGSGMRRAVPSSRAARATRARSSEDGFSQDGSPTSRSAATVRCSRPPATTARPASGRRGPCRGSPCCGSGRADISALRALTPTARGSSPPTPTGLRASGSIARRRQVAACPPGRHGSASFGDGSAARLSDRRRRDRYGIAQGRGLARRPRPRLRSIRRRAQP